MDVESKVKGTQARFTSCKGERVQQTMNNERDAGRKSHDKLSHCPSAFERTWRSLE